MVCLAWIERAASLASFSLGVSTYLGLDADYPDGESQIILGYEKYTGQLLIGNLIGSLPKG